MITLRKAATAAIGGGWRSRLLCRQKAQLGVYDANGLLRRFSDNGTNSYAKLVRQNKLSFSPLAVVRQGELRMKTE